MYDDFDMMAEQQLYPWIDDPSLDASDEDLYCDDCCDDMDGDHDSAMTSCGWGTDEDYGFYGDEDY